MNENRILALIALLAALLLGACSGQKEAPPLEGAAIGGPFTLTSHEGRPVSNSDFDGRYRLVYFGYSYCPDVCPVDLQQLMQGLRLFERRQADRAARVQPLFISIDPERDTPAVLTDYVAAFHPRLIGLTGTAAQIKDVAKRYGVYFARAGEPGAEDYLMDHSRAAMLFGPQGEPIAVVPHDQGADAVAAELARWVK
jgi:protein SCO1